MELILIRGDIPQNIVSARIRGAMDDFSLEVCAILILLNGWLLWKTIGVSVKNTVAKIKGKNEE